MSFCKNKRLQLELWQCQSIPLSFLRTVTSWTLCQWLGNIQLEAWQNMRRIPTSGCTMISPNTLQLTDHKKCFEFKFWILILNFDLRVKYYKSLCEVLRSALDWHPKFSQFFWGPKPFVFLLAEVLQNTQVILPYYCYENFKLNSRRQAQSPSPSRPRLNRLNLKWVWLGVAAYFLDCERTWNEFGLELNIFGLGVVGLRRPLACLPVVA